MVAMYTTQDKKFLRDLHIDDEAPRLESAYPKPEKHIEPKANGFMGDESELLVTLGAYEQIERENQILRHVIAEKCKEITFEVDRRLEVARERDELRTQSGKWERIAQRRLIRCWAIGMFAAVAVAAYGYVLGKGWLW